jgi:prepilin-type N-terminal cleavage/methylation domain-containing protein
MKQRAFTLIELLVVIAIIAILAAILFPVFAQAKAAAKRTADVSNAQQLSVGIKLYLVDYDDTMPIFYAYNSQPPAGKPGHKGIELELQPYCKSKDVFRSPMDVGGPFLAQDVPKAATYWQAYGSSYRFTQCMYTIAANESSQNNVLYTTTRPVKETEVQFPDQTRAMRLEMMSFFSKESDTGCATYGYDCPPPANYYKPWDTLGGSIVFIDGHGKHIASSGQFDEIRVDPDGHKSGEPDSDPAAWTGTWYSVCD